MSTSTNVTPKAQEMLENGSEKFKNQKFRDFILRLHLIVIFDVTPR